MASAEGESECTELLTEALINVQIHNSYTMDEFKELFPRKYRYVFSRILVDSHSFKKRQLRSPRYFVSGTIKM